MTQRCCGASRLGLRRGLFALTIFLRSICTHSTLTMRNLAVSMIGRANGRKTDEVSSRYFRRAAPPKHPQFHDHSLQSHRFAEGRKPNFQLDVRTHLSENGIVKGAEFERRIQKLARRMQVACQFVADKGKGCWRRRAGI